VSKDTGPGPALQMTTTEARPGDKAPASTVRGWHYTAEWFPAGQHTLAPGGYRGQLADVCARHTGYFELDLDLYKPRCAAAWEASTTRNAIGDRAPYVRRGTEGSQRYLVAVTPDEAAGWWPVAGAMGWGEIRSAGIAPSPGALHPSGDTYGAQDGPDPVRYPDGTVLLTNYVRLAEVKEALTADGARNADTREMGTRDADLPHDDGRCPFVYAWLDNCGRGYFTGASKRGDRANRAVNYLKLMDAEGHRVGGWIDEVIRRLPGTSERDFEGMWATAPVPADVVTIPRYCCSDLAVTVSANGHEAASPPASAADGQAAQAPGGESGANSHEAPSPNLLARVKTGAYLNTAEFAPLHYQVDGLVPEGLTVLTGAPKIGKSWLVLSWLLELARKGSAVLYLALEDSDRRMQWRCRRLGCARIPEAFRYMTEEDVVPGMLLPTVGQFVREHHEGKPLVVLDTLAKAMQQTPRIKDEAAYERDYRVTSELQKIVKGCPGAGLLICHHDRKTGGEDWMDRVSGTKGITGGPDAVLYLERRRGDEAGALHVSGRDIAEDDYAMTFADRHRWELDGGTLYAAAGAYTARKAAAGLADRSAAIVALAHQAGAEGIRAATVADRLDMPENAATEYLRRLDESRRLRKPSRGLYMCVCCVCSPPAAPAPPLPNTHNTHDPTEETPRSGISVAPAVPAPVAYPVPPGPDLTPEQAVLMARLIAEHEAAKRGGDGRA
jgi:AAA domain